MRALKSSLPLLVASILLAYYFWWFTRVSLITGFSHDDLMNLVYAWREPFADIVKANFFARTNVVRPFGQLFYISFFQWFGLDASPYRSLCYSVLWLNVGLTYYVLRSVSRSSAIGAVGALLHCCHPNYFPFYYGSGNCYDAFSFFFYFSVFGVVLFARQNDRLLSTLESAALAVLAACSYNSKEAAASLPPMLLFYELLFHGRPRSFSWAWREGRAVLITGLILLAFLWARFTGPNTMLTHPAYHPVISLDRYLESTAFYLNELSAVATWWTAARSAMLIGAMGLIALILRDRLLAFATGFVILAATPIAFVQPRGIASYYIPLTGYALFLATLLLRWWRRNKFAEAAVFLGVYAAMWHWQSTRRKDMTPYWQELAHINQTVAEFRRHPEWFQPKTSLLIVSDTFPENDWASNFLAELVGRQREMSIHTYRKMEPRPDKTQIDAYTHVIGYENGRYVEFDRARLAIEGDDPAAGKGE